MEQKVTQLFVVARYVDNKLSYAYEIDKTATYDNSSIDSARKFKSLELAKAYRMILIDTNPINWSSSIILVIETSIKEVKE